MFGFLRFFQKKKGESLVQAPMARGDWRGIRIAAPEIVHWLSEAKRDQAARAEAGVSIGLSSPPCTPRIILAGTWGFDWTDAQHRPELGPEEPVIVIRRLDTGEEARRSPADFRNDYDSVVRGISRSPAPDIRPEPPGPDKGAACGGSFDLDLGLVSIPRPTSALTYLVFAEYGPYRSNEVRIRVLP